MFLFWFLLCSGLIIDTFGWVITDGGTDQTPPDAPTLAEEAPLTVDSDQVTVVIMGEVGSTIHVNGGEIATIGIEGRTGIVLDLEIGENEFEVVLVDDSGNSSDALHFVVNAPNDNDYFISTWNTNNGGTPEDNQINIYTIGDGYNYNVDWGDGEKNSSLTTSVTHTYLESGRYTVKISGSFPRIYFYPNCDENNCSKPIAINQWGTNKWSSMAYAFSGCENLEIHTSDNPDLSNVTDMSYMFYGTTFLDPNINEWNVSNVTNMMGMFWSSTYFNSDISNWNVSNVTNMHFMFCGATNFNQNLGDWNVSNVTDTNQMFRDTDSFNQNLDLWDVSKVTDKSRMFMNSGMETMPIWY